MMMELVLYNKMFYFDEIYNKYNGDEQDPPAWVPG
jgi:hypothetical protein